MVKMFSLFLLAVVSLGLFSPVSVLAIDSVDGREIEYSDGEVTLKGYLSLPPARFSTFKLPIVLIVHENWGINKFIRERADLVASQLGYIAFAVDLLGDGKQAADVEEAQSFERQLIGTPGIREQRFRAALEYLSTREDTDMRRLAAVGYSFGGRAVLDMVRIGMPFKGVVSFHGDLTTRMETKKIKSLVRVFHGGADSFVSAEELAAFKIEMRKANAPLEVVIYKDAKRGFSDRLSDEYAKKFGIDVGYHKRTDKVTWKLTLAFLKKVLFSDREKLKFKRSDQEEGWFKLKDL